MRSQKWDLKFCYGQMSVTQILYASAAACAKSFIFFSLNSQSSQVLFWFFRGGIICNWWDVYLCDEYGGKIWSAGQDIIM